MTPRTGLQNVLLSEMGRVEKVRTVYVLSLVGHQTERNRQNQQGNKNSQRRRGRGEADEGRGAHARGGRGGSASGGERAMQRWVSASLGRVLGTRVISLATVTPASLVNGKKKKFKGRGKNRRDPNGQLWKPGSLRQRRGVGRGALRLAWGWRPVLCSLERALGSAGLSEVGPRKSNLSQALALQKGRWTFEATLRCVCRS